jgi:hypothetical protein
MPAFIVPAFIYGAGPTTFIPTYPPVNKLPVDGLRAVRHDSITSDGTSKQSVLERLESIQVLEFTNVPQADLASWSTFLSFALSGGTFKYCPDSTQVGTFENFTLEDTSWVPRRAAFQLFSFSLNLRKS